MAGWFAADSWAIRSIAVASVWGRVVAGGACPALLNVHPKLQMPSSIPILPSALRV